MIPQDHEEAGLSLLVTQYKAKPRLSSLISSYLAQAQVLEGVLFDVLAMVVLWSDQVGEQIDLWGRVFGQAREGRSDADYLPWLRAKILVSRSSGQADDLLKIAALLTTSPRSYTEQAPASAQLELLGAFDAALSSPANLAVVLAQAVAGGVNLQLRYSLYDDASTFTCADADVEQADTERGWADDGQTTGGQLADVEQA